MKLRQDFGIRALFGTIIITGSFMLLGLGVSKGDLKWDVLLPVMGSWVTTIIAMYFVKSSNK